LAAQDKFIVQRIADGEPVFPNAIKAIGAVQALRLGILAPHANPLRGLAIGGGQLFQRQGHQVFPQALARFFIQSRTSLVVTGTHGKTTTSSLLASCLNKAKLDPTFMIGGIVREFDSNFRLGQGAHFVSEGDEYDTAFFDKESKFLHYRPDIAIITSVEFDHADIFNSLKDIQKQFHHLIRTVPSDGLIIHPKNTQAIDEVLEQGLWSETQTLPTQQLNTTATGSSFEVEGATVNWHLLGEHNMQNALGAIYAAHHIGVPFNVTCEALDTFKGVKRRLEVKHQTDHITLYDDFAHHPSAIQTTLKGLRAKVGTENIIAVLELRSNTMKSGFHQQSLVDALTDADQVLILRPKNTDWDIDALFDIDCLFESVDAIVNQLTQINQGHFVVMSNGSFDDIFNKLIPNL